MNPYFSLFYGPGATKPSGVPLPSNLSPDSPYTMVSDAASTGNPLMMALKSITHSRPAVAGALDSPYHRMALDWMKARGQTPPGMMQPNPYPLPR